MKNERREAILTISVLLAVLLLPVTVLVIVGVPQNPEQRSPPPSPRPSPWAVGSPKVIAENRKRKKYGIRPLDAGWRLTAEGQTDDGLFGSNYEKEGPYGRETKGVARDPRTGELISDMDEYQSGRMYANADGNVHESIAAIFYYRTERLGEYIDGEWDRGLYYRGDDETLRDACYVSESFTPGQLDRLVAKMRRIRESRQMAGVVRKRRVPQAQADDRAADTRVPTRSRTPTVIRLRPRFFRRRAKARRRCRPRRRWPGRRRGCG